MQFDGLTNLTLVDSNELAQVFSATQVSHDRQVTVSVLQFIIEDPAKRERLQAEAGAIARLGKHPNVVAIHAVAFTPEGMPVIVTGQHHGPTLSERGSLTEPQAIELGVKLASALQAAHDRSVVHGNIKPASVVWPGQGEPELGDFGLSAAIAHRAQEQNNLGIDPHFSAPEVLASGTLSSAGDVYSLAAVLYTVLAGDPPAGADLVLADDRRAPGLGPASPSVLAELTALGVSEPYARLLGDALASDPDRRPNAAEFGRALERLRPTDLSLRLPSTPPAPTAEGSRPDPLSQTARDPSPGATPSASSTRPPRPEPAPAATAEPQRAPQQPTPPPPGATPAPGRAGAGTVPAGGEGGPAGVAEPAAWEPHGVGFGDDDEHSITVDRIGLRDSGTDDPSPIDEAEAAAERAAKRRTLRNRLLAVLAAVALAAGTFVLLSSLGGDDPEPTDPDGPDQAEPLLPPTDVTIERTGSGTAVVRWVDPNEERVSFEVRRVDTAGIDDEPIITETLLVELAAIGDTDAPCVTIRAIGEQGRMSNIMDSPVCLAAMVGERPIVSVVPPACEPGACDFRLDSSGFLPETSVTVVVLDPDGTDLNALFGEAYPSRAPVLANGTIDWRFSPGRSAPPGSYEVIVIDEATGDSTVSFFELTAPEPTEVSDIGDPEATPESAKTSEG